MHTWDTQRCSHRLTETQTCVCKQRRTDTQTLHRYTATHRHTPQHDHPCVPSGCHHTHTTNTAAQRQMSPTRTLTPSQALHTCYTLTPCHTHTQAVSHTCKGHKWSVVYTRHGAVSRTRCHGVTHPVSHSQCHPHRAPTPSASPTLPAKPRTALPSRNRAEPDRARPCRSEPCRAPPRPSTRPAAAEPRRAHPIPAEPCRAVPSRAAGAPRAWQRCPAPPARAGLSA